MTALAAKPDRHPNWSDLRSQHPGVQTLVWLFALPVAVWLWAVHLPHERRAPALTFAGMVTVFCLAVPVAAGVGERTAADAAADLADASASTMQPLTPESAPTTAARTTAAPTTAAPTTVAPTTAAPTTTSPTRTPGMVKRRLSPVTASTRPVVRPHPPLRPRRLLRRLHPAM